jgi:hypothetical protein
MEKPKLIIDYNSGMGGVNLSDAYMTSYLSSRKRLEKYYQRLFHYLIDLCCLNSYVLYQKKKGWQHFKDEISRKT